MKKIIIIDHEPLTMRRSEIFRINELLERGINVEHWDMSQYFHKGMTITDTIYAEYSHQILNLKELRNAIDYNNISNTLFIVEVFKLFKYRTFFRILAEQHCFCIKLELYATTLSGNLSLWQKLKIGNIRAIWNAINKRFNYALNLIYFKLYKIHVHALYIGSGNNSLINIHINHPDWEKALQVRKNAEYLLSQRYVVFCDEYFPLHPDLFYFEKEKIKNLADMVMSYRKSMCSFFDRIEKEFGFQVIIAAHPKSDYHSNDFGKRLIFKYKTPELIKDCEFVLLHASTSISYAIIFNKPLIMLTTPEYKKVKSAYYYQLIIEKYFSSHIYNVLSNDPIKLYQISPALRLKYIYNYLTSKGVENQSNTEILFQIFSEL